MIYLKLFEGFNLFKGWNSPKDSLPPVNSAKDIDAICKKYLIKNYTINSDGTIDVNGDVNLIDMNLDKLPLKFNKVTGSFKCGNNQLTSLEGSPKEVGGRFNCYDNQLISLVGAPKWVGGNFYCGNNQLITLRGATKEVGRDFNCVGNSLTSLEGAPEIVGGNFSCNNNKLTSLEGAPKKVGTSLYAGYFKCFYNPLPKLIIDNYEYIDEIIKWQDEYNIWRNGNLDEFRFSEMMIDIKEELKK